MKKFLFIISLITLSACHNVPAWKYDMFKKPVGNGQYPKEYIQGWQDGCESGAEASANHFYRFKYEFRQNWEMLKNNTYVRGWETAYDHCRKYVLQHNLNKMKRSIL